MTTGATMGPPVDPRDPPRRSGRAGKRQNTSSSSGGTSKSPEFALPEQPATTRTSSGTVAPNSGRNRRGKGDEDGAKDSTSRNKRKGKDKSSPSVDALLDATLGTSDGIPEGTQDGEEEDKGITRCHCGRNGACFAHSPVHIT
jgi:hypothetical protein